MLKQVASSFVAAIVILNILACFLLPGASQWLAPPLFAALAFCTAAILSTLFCWLINVTAASRRTFCVGVLLPVAIALFGNEFAVKSVFGIVGLRPNSGVLFWVLVFSFVNGLLTTLFVNLTDTDASGASEPLTDRASKQLAALDTKQA